ncbi:ThuA domain-containing protein [Fulvivirgaceae bacterium BMA10]|uniref:ThuA domain-containing protein n=1 Tax=Splendidivirga corallicola TaxID=3051826 RepID=A0ABT8KI62_9BACT|nr:ThuA domain-containing protein [Fulvivirgaceae bacterium BMA10]
MRKALQALLCIGFITLVFSCTPRTNELSETLILDLEFEKGDHIAIIGNTLADRMQEEGWMETHIQHRFPEKSLSFRNLGFSGDELTIRQRSEGFGSPDEHLTHVQADVIFAFFGFNESFEGEAGLDKFKKDLLDFIRHSKKQKYNNKNAPQIVLFSPIAHEDLKNRHLPDGNENNQRIEMYTEAMASIAVAEGVSFVNLFTLTKEMYVNNEEPLTINGIHLNAKGNELLGAAIDVELFGEKESENEDRLGKINAAVKDKNFHWFNRYRTTDGFNVFGGRSWLSWEGISNRDVMLREMEMFDVMTHNRDNAVWAAANGKEYVVKDDNLPEPIVVKSYEKGKQTPRLKPYIYLGGEETIGKMTYPSDLEVNLFASEEQFPDLINPVQMAFDSDERLWVVTWPTYPHWNPRGEMNDKILILPDEDGDGKADEAIVWADGLNSVTGFVFWNGGVVVAAPPELYFMKDTDGDDKADFKMRLLDGISSADSHHSANSMLLGADGALYYGRGIFNKVQLETPYGPFRKDDRSPGIYRFDPLTFEYSLHFPLGANPHGDVFDQWGYQFVTNGTGGNGYYINIGKGQPARQFYTKRVRPVPGTGIISSEHFPESYNGDYLICNVIGVQGILQYDFVYEGADIRAVEKKQTLLLSDDPNFRPAGAEIGGDGALYILDWHNALIGHMQHNIRDPGRDHKHGRIYRMTAKGRPLLKPVKMKDKPIGEILQHLRSRQNGTRTRVRTELTGRETDKVLAEVDKFAANLNPKKSEDAQPLLECLWIYQMHRVVNKELLEKVLEIPDARTRSAGVRVLGHWGSKVENGLTLLKKAAMDPEPLVRAQAVLAANSFEGLEASEIIFEVSNRPLDIQLDEQIAYARKSLDIYWKEALKNGQKLSDAGVAFVLKNGSADEIFRLDQTEEVSRTLLVHQELPTNIGQAALENLEKLTGKDKAAILLESMQNEKNAGIGLYDLFSTLTAEELKNHKNGIWSLFSNKKSSTRGRVAATNALMKIGETPEDIYRRSVVSSSGISALLNALQVIEDGEKRDAYYPYVRSMLFDKTDKLDVEVEILTKEASTSGNLGQLAIVNLMDMPGHESEAFADLNQLLEQGKLEGIAINTLSELDMEDLSESKVRSMANVVLDYLSKVPPFERDQDSFKNGSKLVRKLSLRLPKEEYEKVRNDLRGLQMAEINIRSVPEKMKFDLKEFSVIAGQPVKIIFTNPDAMPHNVLILNPGKAEEIGVAAGAMKEGFVPESKEVLAASRLISEGEIDVIKFMAPETPDDYDFICSYPGHWALMRGIMKVMPAKQEDSEKYKVVYKGEEGPGLGKNIVFVAGDHEYRSEESLPALARILAKRYGFTCTVVWPLDEGGHILPGSSNLRGLEALEEADLMVIFTRFSNFMDEQMEYIDDYLERGGPVIGLRTATHAFSNKSNAKWEHYSFNYDGPKRDWNGGFGETILGETWVGHYGKNHEQASKIIIDEAQKEHPIMRGVEDIWAQSGGYKAYPRRRGGTILARGKILNGMTPDAKPDKTKQELPVAWVRNYTLESGASGRVFTTTHGASEDLLSKGFRRMVLNACFWAMEMEEDIKTDNNIEFVGEYKPTTFNFDGYKAKVKPSDLADWESLIMPGEIVKKDKQ